VLGCGSDSETDKPPPEVAPDLSWGEHVSFDTVRFVRPPGETYGSGDGSSWENAYAGLPSGLERGTRYYLASGDYGSNPFRLETPEDGERYIGLFKATANDHGDDVGWNTDLGEGPATMGPVAIITGYYLLDGQVGQRTSGYGFELRTDDCQNDQAKIVNFPWDSAGHHVILRHLDLGLCGSLPDEQPSHDVIYGNVVVTHVRVEHCYLHDANRGHFLTRGWRNILIDGCYFARSGRFQENSSLNFGGGTGDVTVRNSTFEDTQSTFVSLRGADNVRVYNNVFFSVLGEWEIYSSIEITGDGGADHVVVYGNTFVGLHGLNTGIRLGDGTDVQVRNNLWAGCRTNQIMLTGDHDYNAFYDNLRVDHDPPIPLDAERIEEDHAVFLDSDPFVDGAANDLHLASPIPAGESLEAPYDTDLDGNPRGTDGNWDRGAYEFAE